MTSLLLIFIAVILFLIAKVLYSKADNQERSNASGSRNTSSFDNHSKVVQEERSAIVSYWESWKNNNTQKASVIENSLNRDISAMYDKDAKEIIDSFNRMAHANNITDWTEIKPTMLLMLTKMVDALGEEKASEIIEQAIQEEISHTRSKKENAGTYIGKMWLEESKSSTVLLSAKLKESNKYSVSYLSSAETTPLSSNRINEVVEQFSKEYKEQLITAIGDNAKIKFFCEGYDSPIAKEIMTIMYSYLRNDEFIAKAKNDGLWNKLFFRIVEDTNTITEKYCNADVQECIEYYNFPNKPVVTSRRCPTCGSRNVYCEEIGDYECMSCGAFWHAPHGRNTYSEY